MIHKLEELLFEKTKDSQSDILYTQWIYDKKLVPRVLSLVSGIFPHYSMHDQSHSETIINNIVRLIGEDAVKKFTAIDIWLLLTSAYYHDIGMVIPADDIDTTFKSQDFINYVLDIKTDISHPLYPYAIHFKDENDRLVLISDSFGIHIYDSIKFLLADYFRRIHASRSARIIQNPLKEISLNSPRGIIPPRLINILGAICASHTESFDKVLELPHNEVGIDIYDAHPRYIACLLRLGDLLDLDNNRFSDVFLRSVKSIPKDSLLHKEKHFSICHFSVDTSVIDIEAKCDDYNVASITQSWFEFIRKEVVDQMLNWNNIVPNKSMGYLPTIKNLKVILNNWEYIHENEKPVFKVDNDQALQLLKGAGIYRSPMQALREILQNAVDASLIKLWLENRESLDFSSPLSTQFKELIFDKYPISVDIEERISEHDKDSIIYDITIEDEGIGISLNDLKYLSRTGSSRKNKLKQMIVKEMPEWLKPSGEFGIGFQSVFMLTDLVKVYTKSFLTSDDIEIELSNPESERRGDIMIKKRDYDYSHKFGTKLNFSFKASPVFESNSNSPKGSIPLDDIEPLGLLLDPFVNKNASIELEAILREIKNFAKKSYLNIVLKYNGDVRKLNGKSDESFKFYDADESIHFNIGFCTPEKYRSYFYYRNQRVRSRLHFHFLRFDINILNSHAKEVLTIDRNFFNYKFEKTLRKRIIALVMRHLPTFIKDEDLDNNQLGLISMFIQYYWSEEFASFLNKNDYDQWKNYTLVLGNQSKTLNDILMEISDVIVDDSEDESSTRSPYEIKEGTLYIYENDYSQSGIRPFLYHIIKESFPNISEEKPTSKDIRRRFRFRKSLHTADNIYSDRILRYITGEGIEERDRYVYTPLYSRYVIPCEEKYSALEINETENLRLVDVYYYPSYIYNNYPMMISPFVAKPSSEDGDRYPYTYEKSITRFLIEWVTKNNKNPNITEKEVEDTYNLFVNEYEPKIDEYLKTLSKERNKE